MKVSLDPDRVERAFQKAFQEARKHLRVKGFRKGKVPEKIASQSLGDAQLLRRVVKLLVPQAYKEAIQQEKLRPLAKPDWQLKQCERGQELIFEVSLQIFPVLEISAYEGFPLQRPHVKISDQEVEEVLQQRRQGLAKYHDREPGANVHLGDFCVIDYSASHQGKDLPHAQVKGFLLEMRAEKFLPGFVDQLLGARLGERRNFSLRLPENYAHQRFAGESVDFEVEIHHLKQRLLPPLDDAFAHKVAQGKSLAEFRDDIRRDLEARARRELREEMVNEIIKALVQHIDIGLVPSQLREEHTQRAFKHHSSFLQQQGLTLQQYLEKRGISRQQFSEELALSGLAEARLEILYRNIAKREKVMVTPTEVTEAIRLQAELSGRPAQDLKAQMQKDGGYKLLAYRLLIAKVRRLVLEKAKVTFVSE